MATTPTDAAKLEQLEQRVRVLELALAGPIIDEALELLEAETAGK